MHVDREEELEGAIDVFESLLRDDDGRFGEKVGLRGNDGIEFNRGEHNACARCHVEINSR